ncbi:protein D3-like [Anthonomus grandis grandis]|uniref:protein D3-like n=1 Tax=Anthonomus grandis grandis TaxID=2921223 RepID=UPI0021653EE3|nr:protein D3-like [Anthonomus grandis grandis]
MASKTFPILIRSSDEPNSFLALTMMRVTFLFCFFVAVCYLCPICTENLLQNMEKEKVVPEVIDKAPSEVAEVVFPSGAKAEMGKVLTPTLVKDQPKVKWNADPNSLYTVCMTDPDAPSRSDPKFREWHHWLVGNVPGDDISKGEALSEYVGAGPPKGSGLHRYVILVYKQKKKLTFDEPRIPKTSGDKRPKFAIRKFAKKYDLDGPIAGNFFQAEWDDYVPLLYKQLSS